MDRTATVAVVITVCALISCTALAQMPGITYERLLVPVVISQPLPGAYGSLWSSALIARNDTDADVPTYPIVVTCQVALCPPAQTLAAHRSVDLTNSVIVPGEAAALLFVERDQVDNLSFSLRVQDVSRQSLTWGTAVPVVREREYRSSQVTLIDVPADNRFRNTLRVFDPDGVPNGQVTISLWRMTEGQYPGSSDQFLGENTYALTPPPAGHEWHAPAYLQLSGFSDFGPLNATDRLAVRIKPATAGMRIWAFDSITNNDTQHVTLALPQ